MSFGTIRPLRRAGAVKKSSISAAARARRTRRSAEIERLEERQLLAGSITLNATSWTPVGPAPIVDGQVPGRGPVTGRLAAVAADPSDPSAIYVAAAGGGIWKTVDGGQDWTPLTDNQSTMFMGALAVAPSNANVIYGGTGEANNSGDSFYGRGILKSTDAGKTWALEGQSQFDRLTVAKIIVSPTDPNTVFAAICNFGVQGLPGTTGVYRTTDGGSTWTNTTSSIGAPSSQYTDVVMDPSNPKVLYCAIGTFFGDSTNGIYKSTDGGDTWALAGNAPSGTGTGRISLTISPSNPQVLYDSVIDPRSFNLKEIDRSADGGKTWAPLSNAPNFTLGQGLYDTILAVDPKDSNVVYAGGSLAGVDASGNFIGGMIETRDGGQNWFDISVGANGNGPHVDYHGIGFTADGKLIVGNDGGIWRLDNPSQAGIRWADLNGNLQITEFVGIALHPTDPNIIFGGSQDNGTEMFNGALGWHIAFFGDGGQTAIDQTNPSTVYQEYVGLSLRRSDSGGAFGTFSPATNGINTGDPSNFYVPYVMDPSNSSRLLLGSNHLYETTDKANNWNAIGVPGAGGWNPQGPVDAIAIAPTDPKTIYAAAGGSFAISSDIFVTTDDGATWTKVDVPGASDHFGGLTVDPSDSKTAYAVRDRFDDSTHHGHVFKTTDGGSTWTDISNNLPDLPTHTIVAINQFGLKLLAVGTDNGVFSSFDGGTTWSRFKSGMPNVDVSQLVWNQKLNILAAATYGRGAWETIGVNPLTMQVLAPQGVSEKKPLSGVTVATFTDISGGGPVTDYTATLDWGDGGVTTGKVLALGAGKYAVQGDYTYNEGGSFTLTVSVAKQAAISTSGTVPVTVSDLPLTASGMNLVFSEGTMASPVVATFSDADPSGLPASSYNATINWGDGTTTTGVVAVRAGGGFQVTGSHAYGAGPQSMTVSITDSGGATTSVTNTFTVSDTTIDAHKVNNLTIAEGAIFSGPVATFVDHDPRALPTSYYRATIDWGDGVVSQGTIAPNPAGAGYAVLGTHVFKAGKRVVSVSIHDGDITTATNDDAALPDNSPITSTITVNPAAVGALGLNINSAEGIKFAGVVANFFSSNPFARAADFTSTIDWGDGSMPSAGVIDYDGAGQFVITGKHTFPVGQWQTTVTLTETAAKADNLPGADTVANSVSLVTDAPLVTKFFTFAAAAGVQANPNLATFVDANPGSQVGDFSASINWGDGSALGQGTITARDVALGGGYIVAGSTTYQKPGTYPVTVTVTDTAGTAISQVQGIVTVTDAPITASGTTFDATEGVATGSIVVANFQDANPFTTAADFSATIAWGDGTSSTGTVVAASSPGTYQVTGGHTFGSPGSFPVSITVTSSGGSTGTGPGTANVADRLLPLTGSLEPGSDTGRAGDWITANSSPTFQGTAEGGANVTVYVQPAGQSVRVPVGQGTANAFGVWRVTIGPLVEGSYHVFAQATDSARRPSSLLTPLNAPTSTGALVIATSGPRVTSLVLDPKSDTFRITYQSGSPAALDPAALLNPANYSLALPTGKGSKVFGLISLTLDPTSPGTVLATFGAGRMRGSYILTLSGAGVTDLAGNPLDERFFLNFPGTDRQPGQPFVAQITTDGRTASAPQPFVPPDQLRSATQFESFIGRTVRFPRPRLLFARRHR
jgi:photosystem II stability/assembly factor-like uncharacterized protein